MENKGSIATTVMVSRTPDLSGNFICDGVADEVQINEALDYVNVLGGGRVILLEGTYNLTANITIGANEVLEGQGFSTVLIPNDASITNGIVIGGDNVQVKNMVVTLAAGCGTGGARPNVIFADGRALIWLENLWIVGDNTVADDGSTARQHGIYFDTVTDSHIVNCRVVDNARHGIRLQDACINNAIKGNTAHGNTRCGIRLGTNSTDNLVANNICDNNGYSGIEFNGGCDDNTAAGNIITDNTRSGILVTGNSRRCNVTGNICNRNQYGIYIESSRYAVVGDNICERNVEDGLVIDNSWHSTVSGNVCVENDFEGNACSGITIEGSHRSAITGNMCYGNGLHGIYLLNGDYITVDGNTTNNQFTGDGIHLAGNTLYDTISDNVCYANASDGIEISGGAAAIGNHITGNMMVDNALHGINNTGYKSKIEDNFIRHTGIGAAGTYHGIYLTATADGCQVNDNTIYDSGDATEDGIHLVDGCVSCQINGNYVYNTMGNGIRLTNNNDNCQVNNNHIQGVDDRGIWLTGSSHCTVNSNLVTGSGITSIAIHTGSTYNTIDSNNCEIPGAINIEVNGNCTHNDITGNNCRGATVGSGIICTGTSHACTVTGNHCDTNQYGIYIESSNDCVVTGNTVMTSVEDGIVLDNAQDCTVAGNVSTDNDTGATGCSGITVWDSHRNTISGNTCDHNGLHGIYVYRGDHNNITGNSCNNQDTGDGIHIFGDGGRNSDFNIVSSNVCTGNADDGVAIEGVGDANKNIVIGNQLLGNGGTPLVDNGTATETGHNITA